VVIENIGKFFDPESIAIIGASRTPGKAGYEIVRNILDNGFKGKIFLVNPHAKEILGIKAYPSVKEIPCTVDLAVLTIPAEATTEALKDCAERKIEAVVIASGGYAEIGEAGMKLQTEILRIAEESGIRIIGPNTSGIISTPSKLTASLFPLGKIRRGSISYIAQTGNFATHTMKWIMTGEEFGISRVVGLGNKCDVDDADVLEFLGEDAETKAIIMYVEGFKDARKLIEVAKKVSKKKPIVALKAGRTASGMQSAFSHTASMASNDSLVDAAFKQAGIVRVHKYSELINAAKALAFQPVPKGNKVAVLAPSGAMAVIAADACESIGLKIARLSEETLLRIRNISTSWIAIRNPVDMWGAVQTSGVEASYRIGMEAALSDRNVDAIVLILVITREIRPRSLGFIDEISQRHKTKPVLVTITGDKQLYEKAKRVLGKRGIPVFPPIEDAFVALSILYRCGQNLRQDSAPFAALQS